MSDPDALFVTLPPRPWVRRLVIAGFALFVLGTAGIIQLSSMTATIAIALPPTPDLAAQVYRADLFHRIGFAVWDASWYGGHHMPGYSLIFPPLGASMAVAAIAETIWRRWQQRPVRPSAA